MFRCRVVLTVVNLVSLLAHVQVSCCSDSDESRQSLSTCSGVVLFEWWISSVSQHMFRCGAVHTEADLMQDVGQPSVHGVEV